MSEILQKTGLVERSGQGVDKLYYCDVLSCVCDCFTDYYKKSNNLIEPAVSSAVAYGRCITSNGLVLSCSDNEALPKGEV